MGVGAFFYKRKQKRLGGFPLVVICYETQLCCTRWSGVKMEKRDLVPGGQAGV